MNDNAPPITIVLVDDHPIIRSGLRALLAQEPDCQIVGEASDGLAALLLIEQTQPDVVIADVTMPGLNGLDMTMELTKRFPDVKVILLSMYTNEAFVREALRNGALGYVIKDSALTELVHAVHEVAAGRRYLSAAIADQFTDPESADTSLQSFQLNNKLTPREREVLQLVAEGLSNNEVGKRLFISPRTVEIHRAAMMKKLGLKTHIALVAYAVKNGIIQI